MDLYQPPSVHLNAFRVWFSSSWKLWYYCESSVILFIQNDKGEKEWQKGIWVFWISCGVKLSYEFTEVPWCTRVEEHIKRKLNYIEGIKEKRSAWEEHADTVRACKAGVKEVKLSWDWKWEEFWSATRKASLTTLSAKEEWGECGL